MSLEASRIWKIKHRAQRNKVMREYRRKTKILVMTHYCKGNPHCMCPGCCTIFIGFLQMDHINGGGSKNRVEAMITR